MTNSNRLSLEQHKENGEQLKLINQQLCDLYSLLQENYGKSAKCTHQCDRALLWIDKLRCSLDTLVTLENHNLPKTPECDRELNSCYYGAVSTPEEVA